MHEALVPASDATGGGDPERSSTGPPDPTPTTAAVARPIVTRYEYSALCATVVRSEIPGLLQTPAHAAQVAVEVFEGADSLRE
jgi:hypothetical protein